MANSNKAEPKKEEKQEVTIDFEPNTKKEIKIPEGFDALFDMAEVQILPSTPFGSLITLIARYQIGCLDDNDKEITCPEEKELCKIEVNNAEQTKILEPLELLCYQDMKLVIEATGLANIKIHGYYLPQDDGDEEEEDKEDK